MLFLNYSQDIIIILIHLLIYQFHIFLNSLLIIKHYFINLSIIHDTLIIIN